MTILITQFRDTQVSHLFAHWGWDFCSFQRVVCSSECPFRETPLQMYKYRNKISYVNLKKKQEGTKSSAYLTSRHHREYLQRKKSSVVASSTPHSHDLPDQIYIQNASNMLTSNYRLVCIGVVYQKPIWVTGPTSLRNKKILWNDYLPHQCTRDRILTSTGTHRD